MTKPDLDTLLVRWINQRPRLEYGNYGCPKTYRSESLGIQRQRRDALAMLNSFEWHLVPVESVIEALSRGGRLSLSNGHLEYTTGQYWPTEYRFAVCRLLSDLLWQHSFQTYPHFDGTERRNYFKKRFGLGIQKRWFN